MLITVQPYPAAFFVYPNYLEYDALRLTFTQRNEPPIVITTQTLVNAVVTFEVTGLADGEYVARLEGLDVAEWKMILGVQVLVQ